MDKRTFASPSCKNIFTLARLVTDNDSIANSKWSCARDGTGHRDRYGHHDGSVASCKCGCGSFLGI